MKNTSLFILIFLFSQVRAQKAELLLPLHHTKPVNSAVFSPDHELLLTASVDNSVKLWDIRTGTNILNFTGHTGAVNKAVFSADGKYIVTAGNDGFSFIIEVKTQQSIARLGTSASPVMDVDFHPQRQSVILNTLDGYLNEWDYVKGRITRTFRHQFLYGSSLDVIPDADLLMCYPASGGTVMFLSADLEPDARIVLRGSDEFTRISRIRYLSRRKMLVASTSSATISGTAADHRLVVHDFLQQRDTFYPLACGNIESDESGKVLITGENGALYEIDPDKGALLSLNSGVPDGHYFSAYAGNGRILWISRDSDSSRARIYDIGKGEYTQSVRLRQSYMVSVSQDRELAAIVEAEGIRIISLRYQALLKQVNLKQAVSFSAIAVYGNMLFTSGDQGIGKWDYRYNRFEILLPGSWDDIRINGDYLVCRTYKDRRSGSDDPEPYAILQLQGTHARIPAPAGHFAGICGDTLFLISVNDKSIIGYDLVRGKSLFTRPLPQIGGMIRSVFEASGCKALILSSTGESGTSVLTLTAVDLVSGKHEQYPTPLTLGVLPHQLSLLPGDSLLLASSPVFVSLSKKDVMLFNSYHRRLGGGSVISDYVKDAGQTDFRHLQQTFYDHKGGSVYFTGLDSLIYRISSSGRGRSKKKRGTGHSYTAEIIDPGHQEQVVCLAGNKHLLLTGSADKTAILWDLTTGKGKRFTGHADRLRGAGFLNDSVVYTFSDDHTIRIWNANSGLLKALFYAEGKAWITLLPDNRYGGSTMLASRLAFKNSSGVFGFDQFDAHHNRPDLVLRAMGNEDKNLISSYYRAWQKRISKLGLDSTVSGERYPVPMADFLNRDSIAYTQSGEVIRLRISGHDSNSMLDRYNVWINEVPLFGQQGISIRHRRSRSFDTSILVRLSEMENRIETSVQNVNGASSYRMPLYVSYQPEKPRAVRTYFIGLGLNRYRDSSRNLQWCVKDIRDLCAAFRARCGDALIVDTLFNERVTHEAVRKLKDRLMTADINDKVIIAYSGHGLLSETLDYYLSAYDVDFSNPSANGLPYEMIGDLLDGIPARNKLLLLDACHSGEVDKEEALHMTRVADSLGLLKGARYTTTADTNSGHLGLSNSFELMQNLFVNVGKGTGATVISASAGSQFALERGDLRNGVFTYSILEAMKQEQHMPVSALKRIIGDRVTELTGGLQRPTSRNESVYHDWKVW